MPNTRHIVNKRLAWFRPNKQHDWDEHWAKLLTMDNFPEQVYGLGMLDFMLPYLPKTGPILEAGCGMGQIVHTLRKLGFDCEGVDTAQKTIARIHELQPSLPVQVGDVLELPVNDNHYSGLISLGVIEHRFEGPEPFLKESYRVLKPEGVAIFTVPHFNLLRRAKAKLGCFNTPIPANSCFYQYALTANELGKLLQAQGFFTEKIAYYDPWKGLKDELFLFNKIHHNPTRVKQWRAWANRQKWLLPYVSHMIAFICRKK